jgi:diguanylate cyclase
MESERALLAHRASHDALTALPNRAAFDEQLALRVAAARQHGGRFVLLFIDADNFKEANDAFGHAAGDAVLVALSSRIRETLRSGDFAARIGGDEFVVLVDPLDPAVEPQAIADRLRAAIAQPLILPAGELYRPTASIGFAVFPFQADGAAELLTAADAAMYADKLSNRTRS